MPSSFYPVIHFICLELVVGRLLISSPRQGRCVLIFVKVCFKFKLSFRFINGSLISEFILLSDTLGVSTLVDSINSAKPPGATEATVLGPFYTEDAHESTNMILALDILFDSFRSSGKRRLDRIRREGRLHVCWRSCNRSPRKPYSQCNYWHLGDWWKWAIWYSGTWKILLLRID